MESYQRLLALLFHQVFQSSNSFSLAASMVAERSTLAGSYLMKHADEEKLHWKWIVEDLKNTGYIGADPQKAFPEPSCQAYISFNFFIALRKPIARFGIATMLESLGGTFGAKYANAVASQLSLKPSQTVFFSGHSQTDAEHTEELWQIIDQCELTDEEWGWMCYAAKTAFTFYMRMYDEAAA